MSQSLLMDNSSTVIVAFWANSRKCFTRCSKQRWSNF